MPRSTRKPPAGKNGTSSARRLKKNGKPKMRLWKKFLIAIALIFATGAAVLGIAYAATEVPSPEAVALAQKTTVYYSDGTTPIGSFSGQNREIISCKAPFLMERPGDRSERYRKSFVPQRNERVTPGRVHYYTAVCRAVLPGRNQIIFRESEGSAPRLENRTDPG